MSFKFKGSGTGGGLYAGTSVQGVDTSAPAANTGEVQAHAPNEQVSQPAASQSSNWSAALGFAPMPRRKPTASAKPKPSAQSTALAVAAAAPVLFTANDPALQPTSGNAEPSSYTNIPLPPQSLDDDDINGFRKTEAGQKAAKKAKVESNKWRR